MTTLKQIPTIRCAICNKLVDEVLEMYHEESREWRLKVKCHGDTDHMAIPLYELTRQQVDQIKKQEGVAFSVKRILRAEDDEL